MIVLLTLGIIALVGCILFLIFSPFKTKKTIMLQNSNLDPKLAGIVKIFGGDISALISQEHTNKYIKLNELEKLFKESGNPWKLSYIEFIIVKIILAGLGLIVGLVIIGLMWLINMNFIGIILGCAIPILGFLYPTTTYKSIANKRVSQFKAQLPEAIDYLVLSLSGGGYALPTAFEKTIEYLPDNLIKSEFIKIVNDLHSGRTMESSLNNFADRVPTEGIKSFVKALNNANRLSVSMIEILKNRAKESRRDLENEIDKRIATLESRVTMVFSPTAAISIGIITITPVVYQITTIM